MASEQRLATLEKVLFLKSMDLFENAVIEELGRIAELSEEVEIAAGETIFRAGEPVDAVYLVLKGRVAVEKNGVRIREVGEKQVVDLVAALDLGPAAHSVRALEEVRASSSMPWIFMKSSPRTMSWCARFGAPWAE